MAINTELEKLNDFILETYDTIEAKGGTIPENKNMENLPAAIATLGDIPEPLCFTSTGESTIQLTITGTLDYSVFICYSRDNSSWNTWLKGTSGSSTTLTLTDGQKLYVWNKNATLSNTNSYVKFVMTGSIAASGNCNSMINYNELSYYCFLYLFQGCTSLTTAPELPATTLANECYRDMFYGCTSLTSAPELPATTLKDSCYANMFTNCTSLTTAPELPATTLASYCYRYMFSGCTSLTSVPELPATTLKDLCYQYMFTNCTGLTSIPSDLLPATTLTTYCYGGMFSGCTSLTTPPELPATTLASYCYTNMFYGCTSLTSAPELPATTLASNCYSTMFANCTSLTTAPELPATTLISNCYQSMFFSCSSLKVNENGTEGTTFFTSPSTTSSSYVSDMFYGTGGSFTGTPTANNTYKYY